METKKMERKKRSKNRKVELSNNKLKVDGCIIASVDLSKSRVRISRFWCEQVGLKLCVGEMFVHCTVSKKKEEVKNDD